MKCIYLPTIVTNNTIILPHYTSNNIACDHNRSSGHTKKVLLEIHEIQLIRINYVNHRGDLFTETSVQRYSTPESSVYSLTFWYTKRYIIRAISRSIIWTHCRLYIHNSQANAVTCELIDTKLCKLVTLYIYYNTPFNHNRRRPIVSDLIVCFDCSLPGPNGIGGQNSGSRGCLKSMRVNKVLNANTVANYACANYTVMDIIRTLAVIIRIIWSRNFSSVQWIKVLGSFIEIPGLD